MTPIQNHPAGITAAIATILAPLLILLANAFGADLSEEQSIGITAGIIGLATAIVSWRSPRINIRLIPEISDPNLPPVDQTGRVEDPDPIADVAPIAEAVPPVKKTRQATKKTSTKKTPTKKTPAKKPRGK